MRTLLFVLLAIVLAACDDGRTETDSGQPDASSADAGSVDSGASDAGPSDAGPRDSGPRDSGPQDAGPPADAGPDPCENGELDGSETDVDCGGACGGCEVGGACEAAADCLSSACLLDTCRAHSFEAAADMPTARSHFAMTRGSDGRVYVFGGRGSGSATDQTLAYAPALDAWAALAPMPTARAGVSAAQGANGRIYVVGGTTVRDAFRFQPGSTVTVESFDPVAGTWQAEADLPEGHGSGGAVFYDGRVLVFGGIGGGELEDGAPGAPNPNTLALNETSGVFEPVTGRLSTDQREFGYAVLDGVGVLVAGGWRTSFSDSGTIDAVDLFDGSAWFTREALPEVAHAPCAAALDGVVYVFGGLTLGPTRRESRVRAYVASENTWTTLAEMPEPVDFCQAVALDDTRIIVAGGRLEGGVASAGAWLFTPG